MKASPYRKQKGSALPEANGYEVECNEVVM